MKYMLIIAYLSSTNKFSTEFHEYADYKVCTMRAAEVVKRVKVGQVRAWCFKKKSDGETKNA